MLNGCLQKDLIWNVYFLIMNSVCARLPICYVSNADTQDTIFSSINCDSQIY